MTRYMILNKGQYSRETIEANNVEEALTKAIQKGYEGRIELIRMKKHENIGGTSLRHIRGTAETGVY